MSVRFNIIVPLYNAESWIARNIKTIRAQKYDNYRVVVVNDASTDNSKEKIEEAIKNLDNFSLINKEENGGALNSVNTGIDSFDLENDDVIIVLDGDDWFARPNVLQILNKTYSENDCLMTYGSYIEYPSGLRGKFSVKVPEDVVKSKTYRQSQWMTSHLRTFKYKLWKNIIKEDILDENGDIYRMAGDLPVMFPMLEMAEERAYFIEDIIHVYNRDNPLNEDKVNHELQLSIEATVRGKKVYDRLED